MEQIYAPVFLVAVSLEQCARISELSLISTIVEISFDILLNNAFSRVALVTDSIGCGYGYAPGLWQVHCN